jgi:hypothetical protein
LTLRPAGGRAWRRSAPRTDQGGRLEAYSADGLGFSGKGQTIAQNANLRIYASGSLPFTELDRALDRIISDSTARTTRRPDTTWSPDGACRT